MGLCGRGVGHVRQRDRVGLARGNNPGDIELMAVLMLAVRRGMAGRHSGSRLILVLAGVIAFTLVAGPESVWQRSGQPTLVPCAGSISSPRSGCCGGVRFEDSGWEHGPRPIRAYAVADFGVIANHAHSEWGQWGAEGGVAVLAVMAALFMLALRKGIQTVWGLGLAAVMLHALVDYPLVRLGLGSWWFAMLGIVVSQDWQRRNGPSSTRLTERRPRPTA